MNDILKQLCTIYAAPGEEDALIDLIQDLIRKNIPSEGLIHTEQDRVGNLIVTRKTAEESEEKPAVTLSASLDEAALFITHVRDDGLLAFESAGIMPHILPGKQLKVGRKQLNGVVGYVPIHLQRHYEMMDKPVKETSLFIDIGTGSKEESLKLVKPGEWALFNTGYRETEGVITARALDNRLGAAALLELLLSTDLDHPVTAVFTRIRKPWPWGSAAASFEYGSENILILDTVAADDGPLPLSPDKPHRQESCLGGGPVITVLDGGHIADVELFRIFMQTAEREKLRFQLKQSSSGSSEAAQYQTNAGGGRTLTLSVPCRYQNSPLSMARRSDLEELVRLLKAGISELSKGKVN